MALGEPLPKQIFGHPWLLAGVDKMSKSRGNVMYADDLAARFGVDAIRYYLLKEMPYAQDGSISYETIIARYNSDLANTLGNLVNRTVAMSQKYFDGKISEGKCENEFDEGLISCAKETVLAYEKHMNEFKVSDAIEDVMTLARRSNKYIDETTPWSLAKDETKKERLGAVLYNLIESIRYIAVMLTPIMPATASGIFTQIGASKTDWESLKAFGATEAGTFVGTATPLFSRIDEKKMLEEIEEEEAKKAEEKKKTEEKLPEQKYISIDDFAKLEIKIGVVTASEKVKGADKLLVSKIKIGNEMRQIVSGIAKYYAPEDFVGKKVAVITNLKPVKLRGVLSEGMILAASDENGLGVLVPDGEISDGADVR